MRHPHRLALACAAAAALAAALLAVSPASGQRRARFAALDQATRAFAAAVEAEPGNRAFAELYRGVLGALRPDGGAAHASDRAAEVDGIDALRRATVLFVPGFAWKSYPETGADFARQRALLARLGVENALLEIDENGRVDANARAIADALRRWGRERTRLLVVSTSKGGPETALALGGLLAPAETAPVRGWVSVGGLLRGSPYADRALAGIRKLFARIVLGFQGLSPHVVPDLATGVRRAAFDRLALPAATVKVAFVGAPLSSTVSADARGRFETLAPLGPNDGLTLLADELIPGGLALVELGLDHYFRDPDLDRKTLALALVVAGLAESPPRESR